MNYEKAYKEALERAREFQKSKDGLCVLTAESIFPELRDSEDERIRKELIFYLGDMPEDTELRNGVTNRDVLAWLEKQGEKKATWSEEDEEILKNLIDYFSLDDGLRLPTEETIDWLKSLKERLS